MTEFTHPQPDESRMMDALKLAFCQKIDEFVREQTLRNVPMQCVLDTLNFFGFSLTLRKDGDNDGR